MDFGNILALKYEQCLEIFFNTLLCVKANSVGWAKATQFQRMRRILQIVFGFFNPLTDDM